MRRRSPALWSTRGRANTDYRDHVIDALRFLIGTEDEASNSGQAADEITLATARQIAAFCMAADLIDFDPTTTGSRTGYTTTEWGDWLLALRDKDFGLGSATSIIHGNNTRAHNWGAFCTTARVAIDLLLDDQDDLEIAVGNFRLWLGDRSFGGITGSNLLGSAVGGDHRGLVRNRDHGLVGELDHRPLDLRPSVGVGLGRLLVLPGGVHRHGHQPDLGHPLANRHQRDPGHGRDHLPDPRGGQRGHRTDRRPLPPAGELVRLGRHADHRRQRLGVGGDRRPHLG